MRIALGSDHRGVDLKDSMIASLQKRGIETDDCGPNGPESTDYPDYAQRVGMLVGEGEVDNGILICGTGLGMSIASNKVPRVRAALCITPLMAERARQHNNANVLVLAADLTTPEEADTILDAWLGAEFESAVRHKRRIKKVHMGEQSLVDPLAIYEEDTEVHAAISAETRRQSGTINLCASENLVSRAIREAQGSILTNKYADGYPGKRLHGDCEYVDDVERLALDRAKSLFGAEHVNVQPYSGSLANEAVYMAALEPGDTILAQSLEQGGHVTHGHSSNVSGRLYNVVTYGVNRESEQIDYDQIAKLATESKPKLIIAGCSFYSRIIDFQKMRSIADSVGAYLHADMAHIAGLVAAGCHPSPVPLSEFVTASTHKTLRGPRGGMIMCQSRFAEEIDRQVFPGLQGGPLMHVVAAKAVCFHEAMRPSFKKYQQQVIRNAKSLASEIADRGVRIVSGGTDNHMILLDVGSVGATGKEVASALGNAGISANKCLVPYDEESPFVTSGVRVGTAHVTSRGMGEEEMALIAEVVADLAAAPGKKAVMESARSKVADLASRFAVS